MTTENNITITMQDVDVVASINPDFKQQLLIAAVARDRAEKSAAIMQEATAEKAKK